MRRPHPVPASGSGDASRQQGQTGTKPRISAPSVKSPTEVQLLLARMQAGDRDAAALFVTRYGSLIRRRIRGKLSPAMRRIFDSLEILSTVGRRLDLYVRAGRFNAQSEGQLWALVFRMANNAVIDKSRIFRRLEKVEAEDSEFSRQLLARLNDARQRGDREVEIEIEHALGLFGDLIDKQILSFWLSGTRLSLIAEYVGLAPTAVRKRWQTIRSKLQAHFSAKVDQ